MPSDDIAVRMAKAAKAGGGDGPPLIVLGDGEGKVPDVFGTVVGRGSIPTQYGDKPTLILKDVQAPLGTAREGEHALAMWSAILEDRLADAREGAKVYAKAGGLVPTKGDPSRKYRDYLTTIENPATDSLGQLVEQPEPQRGPEAAGYGNEPPFAPSRA